MIIGISGKIYSGKDTFAAILQKELCIKNKFFDLKSFAYKLKKTGAYLTNTPEEWWFSQDGKQKQLPEWGMTIGEFQQKLGTEACREGLHSQTWVLALMSDYQFYSKWIVTDVRFPNEAAAIKERDGILIRINGDPTGKRKDSKRNLSHESETALDSYKGFDYVIENNSTINRLEEQAQFIYYALLNSGKL